MQLTQKDNTYVAPLNLDIYFGENSEQENKNQTFFIIEKKSALMNHIKNKCGGLEFASENL